MNETAYPLAWPMGWKRSVSRSRAAFNAGGSFMNGGCGRREVSIALGTERVLKQLKLFGVSAANVVISTDVVLRLDGLPRSDRPMPKDPGVAVYWLKDKQQRCIAVDRYDRVADNLAAIAATLEAMRAIERHGGAAILDRAFVGFKALAAPEQPFQVLGVGANASREEVERAYRLLASEHHPDRGGDEQRMARINAARDAMIS
jgi:hypothetical protein